MKRRELLKRSAVAVAGVGTLPAISILLKSCGVERLTDYQPVYLSATQYDTVWKMAELILPKTDSPGADEAGVAPYIDLLFAEYYEEGKKVHYESGLNLFIESCRDEFGEPFTSLDEPTQLKLLKELDNAEVETSFFKSFKSTVLWAYFTSEQGMKSMNYSPVPGRYQGCITINEQEKNLVGNR